MISGDTRAVTNNVASTIDAKNSAIVPILLCETWNNSKDGGRNNLLSIEVYVIKEKILLDDKVGERNSKSVFNYECS